MTVLNRMQSNSVNKVVENYKKIAQKEENVEEYGSVGMATSGLVITIRSIIQSCKNNPELLLKIEPIVFPMIVTSLSPNCWETLDEAMECITSIMNYTKIVTDRMWSLFPHLIKIGNCKWLII